MNYLIYGTSYKLIDEKKNELLKNRIYETFSLSDVNIKDIITDLGYNSMFNEEKVIVIKNFELLFQNKKESTENLSILNEYLSRPSDSVTIIFISQEKISEKTKANKEILSKLNVISTPIFSKSYELSKYLIDVFKKENYTISQGALDAFVTKCNTNYDIAMNEFLKLKKIKTNKTITENDIELYVSNYNTSDIFSFKDAVLNKNIIKARNILEELESSKVEVLPLIVILAKEYIEVLNVKLLSTERLTNEQIGLKLNNMHPYRVKMLRESANKYSIDELKKNILYLCNLDLKYISSDNLGYNELIEFLLIQ